MNEYEQCLSDIDFNRAIQLSLISVAETVLKDGSLASSGCRLEASNYLERVFKFNRLYPPNEEHPK